MLHEKLELRRILKTCLRQMNDIPYEQRDDEVKEIRNTISRKYDKLGQEAYDRLKKIDPEIQNL